MASSEGKRLEVSPPIHRLGAAGRWVRSQLQAGILGGTPVLVRIQGLRSPRMNTLMLASSFLGEEEFYMILVSFVVWVVDAKLGRLMVMLMAMCFYLTGVLKNLLCLPRPPVPPVAPLQRCQDWSLPSHHAVLNVNVPWFIWFYVVLNYSASTPTLVLVFSLVSLWSFCVMFSRMYLGVHSPADILTGGVVGCLLLAVWLQWHDSVDLYLSSAPSGGSILGLLCVVILLLSIHPDPLPVTIIFAETVCMVGVAVGFILGHVFTPPTLRGPALFEQRHVYSSTLSVLLCSALRYLLGLVTLVLMKNLAESVVRILLKVAAQVVGVATVCIKRKSEVSSERVHFSKEFVVLEEQVSTGSNNKPLTWNWDKPLNLDIPVKFLSYITMGAVAVAICPALFSWAGI